MENRNRNNMANGDEQDLLSNTGSMVERNNAENRQITHQSEVNLNYIIHLLDNIFL